MQEMVLIVPYGIETQFCGWQDGKYSVLIVPYGIETKESSLYSAATTVLIVPYGIETHQGCNGGKLEDLC